MGEARAGGRRYPTNHGWYPSPAYLFQTPPHISGACPIRVACGEFAAETGQSGVWGGSEFDRGRLVRE